MPKRKAPYCYCQTCDELIGTCDSVCTHCNDETGNDHTWVIQSHTKSFVEVGVTTYHERCSVCHRDRLRREEVEQ